MKIGLVTACGSYNTHLAWTLASSYHLIDFAVVINGGLDNNDPFGPDDIPLQKEIDQVKSLDVDKKVKMYKASWSGMPNLIREENEPGRARNLSQSLQIARKLGADWVIKIDADELIHKSVTREYLEDLIDNSNGGKIGFRFGMWELTGDYEHYHGLPGWAPEDDQNEPSSNDAAQFFKPCLDDFYYGGGAPVVNTHIVPHQKLYSYHVRHCPPPGLDPFKYFYDRFFYHLFAPTYLIEGKDIDIDQVRLDAKKKALAHLQMCKHPESLNPINNGDDPRIPKETPLVIQMGTKEYIKMKKEEK